MEDRRALAKQIQADAPVPVPDRAIEQANPTGEGSFTKEDFDEALRRATRKVKPPKDEG
jgi:hypothetical protein